jgi:hypothetical protein
MVEHAWNPSYLGGEDQEACSLSAETQSEKLLKQKWAGSEVQVIDYLPG